MADYVVVVVWRPSSQNLVEGGRQGQPCMARKVSIIFSRDFATEQFTVKYHYSVSPHLFPREVKKYPFGCCCFDNLRV